MTRTGKLVYFCVWASARIFSIVWFRISVSGSENVPRTGPLLVIANHTSLADPPLIGISTTRRAFCYMAKQDLWKPRLLGWFLTKIEAIPVARDAQADRKTFMAAVRALKAGMPIIIFPEGTRSRTGEMKEFEPGAAALAAMVPDAPILPVRIRGAYEAFPPNASFPRPRKISVHFGQPFHIKDIEGLPGEKKALYRALSAEMFNRISSL